MLPLLLPAPSTAPCSLYTPCSLSLLLLLLPAPCSPSSPQCGGKVYDTTNMYYGYFMFPYFPYTIR